VSTAKSRRASGLAAALLAGAGAASLGFSGAAQAAEASGGAASAAAASSAAVEEVIVTARKARERLQDVPVAISAFSHDQLSQGDHIRIEDLNQLAPNTNVVITNGHQASFTVRGLGANPANDGLESSAGVFLDGVYLGRPGMAAMDLIDIDQIELLRGPQGTLFGKNTTAGAINITTALPAFKFGAQAQASYGAYDYQQYQGTVTGPLIDGLAARLTAYRTSRDGTVWDVTTHQHVANLFRQGARGQLLFKPNNDFSLRVIGEYAEEQQSTGAVVMLNQASSTPAALQAKLAATGGVVVIDPTDSTTAVNGPIRTGTRQYAASAEANWSFAHGFNLTSLTAYRRWDYSSLSDSDGSSADVINGGYNLNDAQWSQEVRLAFPHGGPVDGVVGLYYFHQEVATAAVSEYGGEAAAWLTGIPDALLPVYAAGSAKVAALLNYNHSRWETWATPHTDSYAAFGQAIWHVTPAWNLTAGFRETYETKTEAVWRPNPTSTLTHLPIPGLAASAAAPIRVGIDNAAPSFLVSSDYHLTPTVMAYALVSRGEKAGGVNSTLPSALGPAGLKVQPEVATDYEVGIKTDLFDRHLRLDLDAFRTDVQDYQATYWSVVGNTTVQVLTNVGKVVTQGVEADVTARPVDGLTLRANGAFNDATYASYKNGPCPLEITGQTSCVLTGRPVAGAPKWTFAVSGYYEHPVADRLNAYGEIEYSWRGQYYGSLDDSRYSLAGDYGLLNLRLGIRDAGGRWDVALWSKNVANAHYNTSYLNYGALIPGVYAPGVGDPRTYGATLKASF
jgi:iron complex outermembrane receptor protein